MTTFLEEFVEWLSDEAELLRTDLLDVDAGVVPEDVGDLRRSPKIGLEGDVDETGFTLEIVFGIPAGDSYPYPWLLNEVEVIRPTNGDVLSWIDSGTLERRFAKFINNPHKGWFDNEYLDWVDRRLDRLGAG